MNSSEYMGLQVPSLLLKPKVPWIGKLSGCFLAEVTIERLGFKKTALMANLIQFLGVIRRHQLTPASGRQEADELPVELTSKEWIQFTMGRMVTYYAVGLCENLVPSYNAEIAPAKHRGLLAGSIMTVTGLGNLWGAGMGQAFATETRRLGWLIAVSMQLIPALMMITLVPFTPESPRWLITKGREEEAERNLGRLRKREETENGTIKREIKLLSEIVHESKLRNEAGWSDFFKGNNLRRIWVSLRVLTSGTVPTHTCRRSSSRCL